jgi:hypothetical protein
MEKDKDERKRPHLRLVVDNAEKRNPRPAGREEEFMPVEELIARRDEMRGAFYRGLAPWQAKAYSAIERFLAGMGRPYGLDPQHGRLIVVPAGALSPDLAAPGGSLHDEVLVYVTEDLMGKGVCLTLEMILPFWSEDDAVMEDALLWAPVYQYGTLFLEENPQDKLLDLIYRIGFPLFPPALTGRLLDRFFATAAYELTETLRGLAEYPEA